MEIQKTEKHKLNLTASKLFAGSRHNPGDHRCYFCGADCDDSYLTKDYVQDIFSNRDIVKFPASKYVCRGCVESLGWGGDEMLMLDGSIKKRENVRGMAPRMYSWVLTRDNRVAFTKAHMFLIRDILCNNVPEPPFSIIIADSGQKQLIFRTPVAMSRKIFPVMLEDEVIEVTPALLRKRIALVTPIVAATGKPALLDKLTTGTFIAYEKYHGNIETLELWQKIQHEPLSRLTAWLSKSKEDAQNEYPAIKCG
jgi:hypothetical protein